MQLKLALQGYSQECNKLLRLDYILLNLYYHWSIPNMLAKRKSQVTRLLAGQRQQNWCSWGIYVLAGPMRWQIREFGSDPLADLPELIQLCQRGITAGRSNSRDDLVFTVNDNYQPFAVSAVYDPDPYPVTKIDCFIDDWFKIGYS